MESLSPILKITETIKQLQADLERKQTNYNAFIDRHSKWSKFANNRPAVKRNFKFFRYYSNQGINHLKDYRDLLLQIHKKKEELLNDTRTIDATPVHNSESQSEFPVLG